MKNIRPKYIFEFDSKKCLTKLNSILKLCIMLLAKNSNCHFDSQMQQFNFKLALWPSHTCSPGCSCMGSVVPTADSI